MTISEESDSIISQGKIAFIGSWWDKLFKFLGKTLCSKLSSVGIWGLEKLFELLHAFSVLQKVDGSLGLWCICDLRSGYQHLTWVSSMPRAFSKHPVPGYLVSTGNTRRDESPFTQRTHIITSTFIVIHTECESWMILCRNPVSRSPTYKIFRKCHIFYSFLRVILHKKQHKSFHRKDTYVTISR